LLVFTHGVRSSVSRIRLTVHRLPFTDHRSN
jgi:hypothetical protein